MHSIKDNAGFAAERSQGYCALHGFCTPQLKQQGFALTPLTSEEADSLLDSSDDFLALVSVSCLATHNFTTLLTCPISNVH